MANGAGFIAASYSYGLLTVTGTAGSATAAFLPSASAPDVGDGWLSFSQDFTAANFGVTQVTWSATLANVTALKLGPHVYAGEDTAGFDDILLASAVPEPSTTLLLALGIASIAAARRRGGSYLAPADLR